MKNAILCLMLICGWSASYAQWAINGTHINNTNTGNVGIGTTAPFAKLQVSDNSLSDLTVIRSDGNNNPRINIGASGGEVYIQHAYSFSAVPFNFKMGNNNLMTFRDLKVGIGTTAPFAKLQVSDNSLADFTVIRSDGNNNPRINVGASGSEVVMQHSYSFSSVPFNFKMGNNNLMTFSGLNVGIGTTTPDAKLTVKGDIHAEEVRVDLNVPAPDYVFEEDYDLWSLAETEQFIKAHKHLPEIPSAAEMEKNGIELKEMNLKLLQKVEELTLHLIEQNKKIEDILEENENLRTKILEIENAKY